MEKVLKIESSGISENFEEIFREYFKPLTWFSQKIVGDHDSAKEIVHSVFVKLWEKKEEVHLDTSLKPYLFRAVHNMSLNFLRNRAKFDSGDFNEIIESEGMSDDFHDMLEETETVAGIMSAIDKLPEKCREVFRLNRFEGKKYKDIATELNISVKTVENQISKALKILREELKDYLLTLIFFVLFFLFRN